MRIALLFVLILTYGCSTKSNLASKSALPPKIDDFHFQVLEIRSSLHKSIIESEPWRKLNGLPVNDWTLIQFSDWLGLQYPKHVERAKLRLLKCHLATIDPKLSYTKELEEMCWSEVERLVRAQLRKTAIEVSHKAKFAPNRPIQDIIHDSIAAHTP